MTTAEYESVVAAYLDTRSLRATARRTGRSFRLVRKVYEQGDGGRPSIREVLAEAEFEERQRLARELAVERRYLLGLHRTLLGKLKEPLAALEVKLDTAASPRELREVVAVLRDFVSLSQVLNGEAGALAPSGLPDPPSAPDPEAVRCIAEDFQRRFPLAFAPEYRSKTIGAIAAVQARRAELAGEAADEEEAAGDPAGRV